MQTQKRSLAFGLGVLIFTALACNFSASTANISSLKLGKDKDVSAETSSFAEGDTVYAVATVSNVPDKVKVKGRLVIEEVEGEQAGPVPGLEKTIDLEGSGTATFTSTAPPTGWPKGRYKVEVMMLNEGGEQKDQKAANFTIS